MEKEKKKHTILKQLSKKFIFVKIHVLKKASTTKFYSGIRRYFVKHLETSIFYLKAESII